MTIDHNDERTLRRANIVRKLKRNVHSKKSPRHRTKPSTQDTRRTKEDIPEGAPPGFGSRRAELERMWREQFPEEGKEDRIQKALKALQEIHENPLGRDLDIETIKKIAEDLDLWDY